MVMRGSESLDAAGVSQGWTMGAMRMRVTAIINVHKEGWHGIHIVLVAMQKPSPYQWGRVTPEVCSAASRAALDSPRRSP